MPLRLRHRPTLALAVIASLALAGLSYAAVQATTVTPRRVVRKVVRRAPLPRITATPRIASIDPASSARYAVSVFQRRRSRRLRFVARGRLPAGARLAIVRRRRGRASARAIVIVTTTAATPAGRYRLRLTAKPVRRKRRGTSHRARTTAVAAKRRTTRRRRARALAVTLTLVVRSPQPAVGGTLQVSGTLTAPLAPGTREPLDLQLASDHPFALAVSQVSVAIERVEAPGSGPAGACGVDDFRVTQYAGPPVLVPAGAATSLTAAGVATDQLPQLEMLDRPVNQDGCKGATIQLRYTAAGERAPA